MANLLRDRRVIIASVLFLVQAGAYYSISAVEVIPKIAPWREFPETIDGWHTALDIPIDPQVFSALRPDDYLMRNYVPDGGHRAVNLSIGYFSSRRDGRGPHSPEWCLPGAGWEMVASRPVRLPVPGDRRPLAANEYLIEKGEDRCVVVYWYHQGQHVVDNDLIAQFYAVPDMLLHGRTDVTLVRVMEPAGPGQVDQARQDVYGLASAAFPVIRQHIH